MTRGMITWFQRTRYRLFSLFVLSIRCQLTSVNRLHNVHVNRTDFTPLFRPSFNNTRQWIAVFLEGGQWRPINRSPIQKPIGQLMSTTLWHVRLSRLSQAVLSTLTRPPPPTHTDLCFHLPPTFIVSCPHVSALIHIQSLISLSRRGVTQPVIISVCFREEGQAGRKKTSFGRFTWSKYINFTIKSYARTYCSDIHITSTMASKWNLCCVYFNRTWTAWK